MVNKKLILACAECSNRNYVTHRKTPIQATRLELNKYCKKCEKHTTHRETK